ncbi:MAG: GFA family protein [Granulosicoccus sp.]
MRHEGGCQCGEVRFVTTHTPVRAMACHCTSCKLRSGSPYGVGVYFNDEEVSFNDGKRGIYRFHSSTSNRWIQNEFCICCGSTVSWTLEMRPGLRAIAGGSYDNPDWYALVAHIWTESARSDMCYPDGMKVCKAALS